MAREIASAIMSSILERFDSISPLPRSINFDKSHRHLLSCHVVKSRSLIIAKRVPEMQKTDRKTKMTDAGWNDGMKIISPWSVSLEDAINVKDS